MRLRDFATILLICLVILLIAGAFRPLRVVETSTEGMGGENQWGRETRLENREVSPENWQGGQPCDNFRKEGFVDDVNLGCCNLRSKCLNNVPIFEVLGKTLSPYMRTTALEVYRNGSWVNEEKENIRYVGEELSTDGISDSPTVRRYKERTGKAGLLLNSGDVQVKPILQMGGFIPTIFKTSRLSGFELVTFFPGQHAFFVPPFFEHPYSVRFTVYNFEEELLRSSEVAGQIDYLYLPPEITDRTKKLAREVTNNLTSPYDKLIAIERFLRSNYIYDEDFTPSPPNNDPIDWFLFEEKRGVCAHFNSAFVVMARSIGIPARAVSGYAVKPDVDYQIVGSKQYHLWAEVLFKDLGWVPFDATGIRTDGLVRIERETSEPVTRIQKPVKKVSTVTMVTDVQETALKGQWIEVKGTVKDNEGKDVSGLSVLIYLKKNKEENSLSLGNGTVKEGKFSIAIRINENMEVGEYHVIAQTIGNSEYLGSWSDPKLKVLSESSISLRSPARVLIDRPFKVVGKLVEKISGEPITSKEVSILVGDNLVRRERTNEKGEFEATLALRSEDNFLITASFEGAEYYLRSSGSRKVEAVRMDLIALTEEKLIRGEEATIKGEIPIGDEIVEVRFENLSASSVKTDMGGRFELRYEIPKFQRLGPAEIRYRVPSMDYNKSQTVFVYGRTSITIDLDKAVVKPKENLKLTAIVRDDVGSPIPFVTVVYEDLRILTATTDDQGRAIFLVPIPENQREGFNFVVSFKGDEFYLPSEVLGSVSVVPPEPERKLILFGAIGAISALSIAGIFSRWRRKKEKPSVEKKPRTSIQISFPQIKEPLPDVWGIGEPLTIAVSIQGSGKEEARVRIDGEENTIKIVEGKATLKYEFRERGVHKIEVECGRSKAAKEVKIVDYREEIIELFKSIFNSFKEKLELGDDATPREFSRSVSKVGGVDRASLENLVSIFEIATYSPHSVGRREYEMEYLSYLSIKSALEEKLKETRTEEGIGGEESAE